MEAYPMKTITDRIIPFYVWFLYGFGIISVFMAIINFGANLVTMITVKGIFVPVSAIPIVAGILLTLCILIGHYFEKYNVWNRITSHQNQRMNPEIRQLSADVKEIKRLLEERK
jgi:fatty acid desaturase